MQAPAGEPIFDMTRSARVIDTDDTDNTLFLVEWSGGARARCVMVSRPVTEGEDGWASIPADGFIFWEERFFLDVPETAVWQEGDLILCTYTCRMDEDDMTVVPENPVRIGHLPGGTVFPGPFRVDDHLAAFGAFSLPAVMERERIAAIAATQEDEALVLWYRDGEGTSCRFIAASGGSFLRARAMEEHFADDGIDPGLWLLADARDWRLVSSDGERERGVDGGWQPATHEDLERFGLDVDEVDEMVAETTGRAGDTAETAMAEAARGRE